MTGCIDSNSAVVSGCIIYANAVSGDDLNDGTTWASAKRNLWAAIEAAAQNGCALSEVWAAAGAYSTKPDYRELSTVQMVSGVNVYGGFAGNETIRSDRDFATHVSIISGSMRAEDDVTDNACTVVRGGRARSSTGSRFRTPTRTAPAKPPEAACPAAWPWIAISH